MLVPPHHPPTPSQVLELEALCMPSTSQMAAKDGGHVTRMHTLVSKNSRLIGSAAFPSDLFKHVGLLWEGAFCHQLTLSGYVL